MQGRRERKGRGMLKAVTKGKKGEEEKRITSKNDMKKRSDGKQGRERTGYVACHERK